MYAQAYKYVYWDTSFFTNTNTNVFCSNSEDKKYIHTLRFRKKANYEYEYI